MDKNGATQIVKNLPRQQKMAVVSLAILTILIIVLWALQFNAQLNRPFSTDDKNKKTAGLETIDLSLKDSDGDGLSDYEEINISKTSPYLEDSDSDSISDKQEVSQGTDPNCPVGKICNGVGSSSGPEASSSETINNTIISTIPTENPAVNGAATIVPGIGNEVTPATLRQILLQNGYDQATLDQISDEDIMKSYQEAVKSSQNNSSNSQ